MNSAFEDKSILLALSNPSTSKLLAGVFNILQFKTVDIAHDGEEGFTAFCKGDHDIIITELEMNPKSGAFLCEKIRNPKSGSPNRLVPVLLTAGQSKDLDIESIRRSGFTDVLLSPFSVDDIKTRVNYILENHAEHSAPERPETPVPKQEPVDGVTSAEEEDLLVKTLLEHYMHHHEVVLQKLRFAQDATMQSIQEIRNVKEELERRDNTNLHEFSNFEGMWKEIIELFLKGGVSEEDIFKIESLVFSIPDDIKRHYNKLTQQDKSFLTLIESMNHDAYRKARDIALKVQDAPNPMTGMRPADYKAKSSIKEASFVFRPSKKVS